MDEAIPNSPSVEEEFAFNNSLAHYNQIAKKIGELNRMQVNGIINQSEFEKLRSYFLASTNKPTTSVETINGGD